jgi:hypothetical protein
MDEPGAGRLSSPAEGIIVPFHKTGPDADQPGGNNTGMHRAGGM